MQPLRFSARDLPLECGHAHKNPTRAPQENQSTAIPLRGRLNVTDKPVAKISASAVSTRTIRPRQTNRMAATLT